MLVRLTYLAVSNAFTALRLLPKSNRGKHIEILSLRHQIIVLQRQLAGARPAFEAADRAFLTALLAPLARETLRHLRLIVHPDTVPRWHRDLIKRRHAERSKRKRPGRPRTVASIRRCPPLSPPTQPAAWAEGVGQSGLLGAELAVDAGE